MKINDVSIDPSTWPTPQLAAVHELLRQRARELGYIEDGASDSDIERASERTVPEESLYADGFAARELLQQRTTAVVRRRAGEVDGSLQP